jgi:hypothetical protein
MMLVYSADGKGFWTLVQLTSSLNSTRFFFYWFPFFRFFVFYLN